MNKHYMFSQKVFLFIFIFGSLTFIIVPKGYMNQSNFNLSDFIGFCCTFIFLFMLFTKISALKHTGSVGNLEKTESHTEKYAFIYLIGMVSLIIAWAGVVIFTKPINWRYNHGDGALITQVLHNVVFGLGPEITFIGHFNADSPYFYSSIFSMVRYWLPFLLETPLYSIYPYPPMHIFAAVLVVLSLGSVGVFWAIRAMGGSKILALAGALGYCILPQVEQPVFFKGNFDVLGFAIMPYVFAALFAKRWFWLYFSSFAYAAVSTPSIYMTMIIGTSIALFFKARREGIIVFLIGLMLLQFDTAVFKASLTGVWPAGKAIPNIFKFYVIDSDLSSVVKALIFNAEYIFILFLTVAFLPLLGLKLRKGWKWEIIGLLFIVSGGYAMGLFRSYSWDFTRNSIFVVPIYLASFLSLLGLINDTQEYSLGDKLMVKGYSVVPILLLSSIISMSLWATWHYPWVGLNHYVKGTNLFNIVKSSDYDNEMQNILSIIRKYVPENASVAYNVDSGLQAFLHNRQKAWFIGLNPEGVEYYVIQKTDASGGPFPWRKQLSCLEQSKQFEPLFKDTALVIYRNLDPQPIPRLESVLHWDVVLRALKPQSQ